MENERRLRLVGLSFELLLEMIRQSYRIENGIECTAGILDDAVIIGNFTRGENLTGYLIISHPSFDIVPMGSLIPEMQITHRLITPVSVGDNINKDGKW